MRRPGRAPISITVVFAENPARNLRGRMEIDFARLEVTSVGW